jgi:hypothetical protein
MKALGKASSLRLFRWRVLGHLPNTVGKIAEALVKLWRNQLADETTQVAFSSAEFIDLDFAAAALSSLA